MEWTDIEKTESSLLSCLHFLLFVKRILINTSHLPHPDQIELSLAVLVLFHLSFRTCLFLSPMYPQVDRDPANKQQIEFVFRENENYTNVSSPSHSLSLSFLFSISSHIFPLLSPCYVFSKRDWEPRKREITPLSLSFTVEWTLTLALSLSQNQWIPFLLLCSSQWSWSLFFLFSSPSLT